jgi:ATP-dependent helicase/nuclease subunit A
VIDVQAFFNCLDGLDKRNQFSPERMSVEIQKLFAAPDVEGEHLQMMTIHKSKGLEFDTVILLGLGTATGGNNSEKPLLLWEEISTGKHTELLAAPFIPKGAHDGDTITVYDFLAMREKVRDANEDARVLYVAATRAERQLHLVGYASKNKEDELKPAANTPLALLWPSVSNYFAEVIINNVESKEKSDAIEDDIAKFTPQLVRLKQLQIPTALLSNIIKNITASTSLQASVSTQTAAPNLAADLGSLAHLYMEMIAKNGLSDWPVSRMDIASQGMLFWLLQRGHVKNEAEKQLPLIINALKRTITSLQGSWILTPRASLQTELSVNTIDGEQRIDLTFIDQGARWIIDYKLGLEVTEANCASAALAYKAQLAGYAALFAHENLPIKTAVFFLSLGQLIEI